MDITLSAAAMGIVPVVMILTSLSKSYIDSKWSPVVSLVLSLAASFFLVPAGSIQLDVVQGILLALTASGLYSGGKTVGNAITG